MMRTIENSKELCPNSHYCPQVGHSSFPLSSYGVKEENPKCLIGCVAGKSSRARQSLPVTEITSVAAIMQRSLSSTLMYRKKHHQKL